MTAGRAFHVPAGYDVYQCGHRLGLAPAGHFADHGWHEEHAIGSTSEWSVPGVRIGTGIRGFAKVAVGPVTIRKLGTAIGADAPGYTARTIGDAVMTRDDVKAINAYMARAAVTPAAIKIKDEYRRWYDGIWFITDSDIDKARNFRNDFNRANATTAEAKKNVETVIKGGMTAETMKGKADRRLSTGNYAIQPSLLAELTGGLLGERGNDPKNSPSAWTGIAIAVGMLSLGTGGALLYLAKPILAAKIAGAGTAGAILIYGTGKVVTGATTGVKGLFTKAA